MLQILRFIRIVRIIRLFTEKRHLERAARHMVSRNKRRYQEDGFDLDLTYVTDRVIAMSFPSTGKMSLYRNPIKDVAKFLDSKHLHCYKVYNLCSEQSYDASYFHGRVERYEIDDHNVPTVNQMVEFVKSVRFWLEAGPKNVIAVHCKGGKGRTGTMICIWLVEAGLFQKAVDSLDYFGSRRTDTRVGRAFQGVETPSQSRYVAYFECIKDNGGFIPPKRTLRLLKMTIEQISLLGKGDGSDFMIEVYVNRKAAPLFRADLGKQFHCQVYHMPSKDLVECVFSKCPPLEGDIQFIVRSNSRKIPKGYMNAAFYFWFHTAFITGNTLRLRREQLDNPHKSKSWRYFGERFAVQLEFSVWN